MKINITRLIIAVFLTTFINIYAEKTEKIDGIIDVKLMQNKNSLEGYDLIADWKTDGDAEQIEHFYLFVKYGSSYRVLTDILLYNCKAGNSPAVGAPAGYREIGHWDTDRSTDAYGVKNEWMINLCVKYGTDRPVKTIKISNGSKGKKYTPRGQWQSGRKYYLYILN